MQTVPSAMQLSAAVIAIRNTRAAGRPPGVALVEIHVGRLVMIHSTTIAKGCEVTKSDAVAAVPNRMRVTAACSSERLGAISKIASPTNATYGKSTAVKPSTKSSLPPPM